MIPSFFDRFVLTYIPDLKWCHLAPMVKDGVFGPERKRSNGRIRWRLVDEKLGKELDISSGYCIPVRSKALKKTADADKEEWDILDGVGVGAPGGMGDVPSSSQTQEEPRRIIRKQPMRAPVGMSEVPSPQTQEEPRRTIRKQPMRSRSAIKPLGGMLTVVKPLKTVSKDSFHNAIQSPRVGSDQRTISPSRRPHRFSPTKRNRSPAPPRVSPRWTPKQNENDEMAPARKARRLNNSGARRCALQL
jgi:hypothetical protein